MAYDVHLNRPLPMSPFEQWFLRCCCYACDNRIGPGDYVWNLQQPGVWRDLFDSGISPEDAVHSQFCRQ